MTHQDGEAGAEDDQVGVVAEDGVVDVGEEVHEKGGRWHSKTTHGTKEYTIRRSARPPTIRLTTPSIIWITYGWLQKPRD